MDSAENSFDVEPCQKSDSTTNKSIVSSGIMPTAGAPRTLLRDAGAYYRFGCSRTVAPLFATTTTRPRWIRPARSTTRSSRPVSTSYTAAVIVTERHWLAHRRYEPCDVWFLSSRGKRLVGNHDSFRSAVPHIAKEKTAGQHAAAKGLLCHASSTAPHYFSETLFESLTLLQQWVIADFSDACTTIVRRRPCIRQVGDSAEASRGPRAVAPQGSPGRGSKTLRLPTRRAQASRADARATRETARRATERCRNRDPLKRRRPYDSLRPAVDPRRRL